MKKLNLIICTLVILLLGACSEEGVKMYDADSRYLYIPKYVDGDVTNRIDTTFVTFMHHPGEETYDVFFTVKLAGLALEEDKPYKMEVLTADNQTTATPDEYAFETEQLFHAGQYEDQLKITLKKTARLDTETVKLTVRLVPNETFGLADFLGQYATYKTLTASVTYNNKISKPTWWDDDIVDNYLGEWTATKYQRFIESCDGEVLDLTDYEGWQKMELAQKFKNDIEANQWLDEDGELIKLPIY